MAADRHLLFGLLALQIGIINQGQLVAAFQAWTLDRSKSLADHLVARSDLDDEDRAAVDALVARHLKKHGGDVEKSLAAVPAGQSTCESLARLADAEFAASIRHLGTATTPVGDDADRTGSYSMGTASSDGLRFRVLRPHARGGLGAVFVALDTELHREVALKQMLDQHADDLVSRQRFVVEAEITGGLEHPGIVPVYGLGTYADGRPFYAMRFIRGDSLKEAIDRFHGDKSLKKDLGRRSLELRRLLGRLVDVCNAIEYAHSRGVLHRDMKPGNIIVGKHGETLVVDWGLAKATGRADPGAGERTLLPSSASGSAETLPGSALGTPAYMSPEQAGGNLDQLGPRSDVYSLGATLYCLLTGKPPFDGDDIGEILRKVQRSDYARPREVNHSLETALEAVCLKAMAKQPEDRYPSCRALVEDLERWMADEPVSAWREPLSRRVRRWGRRNRTAVTAAGVALVVALAGMASVLAVQAKANADLVDASARVRLANVGLLAANERERARFNLAMDAVKLFHGEISEDLLLKEKFFEGLRTRLLRAAAAFYGKLGGLLSGQTDRASRAALGRAYDELGELTEKIGSIPEAMAAHRDALAVRRELAHTTNADAATRADVARSLLAVGWLQYRTGDLMGAEMSYGEGRRLAESAVANVGASDPLRAVLAMAYHRIGRVFMDKGKPAQALASFERGIAICRELTEAHPDDTNFQIDLGVGYYYTGVLLDQTGKLAAALDAQQRALAIRQRLADTHPSSTQFQSELARSQYLIAYQLQQFGKPAEALAAFRRALAIQQKLADANPNVTGFQSDLSNIYQYLSWALKLAGKEAEALAASDQAIALKRKLTDAHPSVILWQSELATNLVSRGGMYITAGRTAEAVASLREAVAVWTSQPTREPKDLYNLGCAHALLARLADQPGSGITAADGRVEADRAMESLRQAVASGYLKLRVMRADTDLDGLRSRRDFQLLLLDLALPADAFAP
jgi:serine/threonine-protein kinase